MTEPEHGDTTGHPGERHPGERHPVREVALVAALYATYSATRLLAGDARLAATGRARGLLKAEAWLGLDVERSLNAALGHAPALAIGASYWYAAMHYLLTTSVLVALYRRRPDNYARARTVLSLATLGALVGYLLLPTAPPRLLPGYVDTLATTSGSGWWGGDASAPRGLGAATNELAAMPSMHVGWALWTTGALLLLCRRPWQRALALAYTPVTVLVVVATANHWVVDALAGAALVVLATLATRALGQGRRAQGAVGARQAGHGVPGGRHLRGDGRGVCPDVRARRRGPRRAGPPPGQRTQVRAPVRPDWTSSRT